MSYEAITVADGINNAMIILRQKEFRARPKMAAKRARKLKNKVLKDQWLVEEMERLGLKPGRDLAYNRNRVQDMGDSYLGTWVEDTIGRGESRVHTSINAKAGRSIAGHPDEHLHNEFGEYARWHTNANNIPRDQTLEETKEIMEAARNARGPKNK